MSRPRAVLIALLAGCCLAACGGSTAAAKHRPRRGQPGRSSNRARGTGGLKSVGLRSGGHQRTYLLYVPPGDSARHPLPLVLVYHGALDTAAHAAGETDLISIDQRRHDMILAFPQGYQNTWNEGSGHTPAAQAHIDDVAFTATILHRIESHYAVNRRQVVATGLSNGALLTELLGCRLAPQLTLIAPVEGQLPAAVSPSCHPAAPVSVYEVHGTADSTIPYGGGHFSGVGGGTTVLAAPASAQRWATLDGCSSQPRSASSSGIELTTYSGCREAVSVTLASIRGGRHAWPSGFGQLLLGAMSSLSAARPAAPAR